MKFIRTPIITIVLIFIIFTPTVIFGQDGNLINEIKENSQSNLKEGRLNSRDTIRIAGDNNYAPYEYVDINGNYKGFNVDITRAIAIELGLDIEIIPMVWEQAISALESGEVDAIQGMTKSNDRKMRFAFTDEIVTNSQAIFVRRDTKYIADIRDLEGLKVSFQKGDINDEVLGEDIDVIPIAKESHYQALESLLNGESEAFIGNRLTGIYYLQKYRNLDEIKIVGEPMYTKDYSMATLKESEEILSLLDEGLAKIKENGTYDKIYKKWFGETFSDNYGKIKQLLYIAVAILLIALAIIGVIMYWNKRLIEEVENRTKELHKQKIRIDQSNRLRGKILEGISSGIVAFDRMGKVLVANTSARDLIEVNIEAGMKWKDLNLNGKIHKYALSNSLKNRPWNDNIEWIKKDGEKYNIDCRILPIKGPEYVEGAILLLHDFTKEKKFQDIINHNDKMQALGKLAAGIAHEIRNPLSSIKGLMALVPLKYEEEEFRERLVRIVNQEISRLSNLVNLLLDYSKPKATVAKAVCVSDIIDEILSLFSVKLRKTGVKVINNTNPLEFFGDVHQVKQVIINLILNSIDAIEENGVIEISSYLKEDKIAIEIKDNGCGIPKDSIDKIFHPFFTMKEDGYGIGLAICHQLIKENQGEIVVDSTLGKGTTMRIYLPSSLEYNVHSVANF